MKVLKISKLQGFVWKTMQAWLDGKVVFLIQVLPCNFWRPLQSLLLRCMAENSQVTYFQYALSACANKIFQKCTVFVFTESWSRDQVMQRAYYCVTRVLICIQQIALKIREKFYFFFVFCFETWHGHMVWRTLSDQTCRKKVLCY